MCVKYRPFFILEPYTIWAGITFVALTATTVTGYLIAYFYYSGPHCQGQNLVSISKPLPPAHLAGRG